MNKFYNRLSVWLVIVVLLVVGAIVVFPHFNRYSSNLPEVITGPKLISSGSYAHPVVGYVFANDKGASKDSIGMQISYANVGGSNAFNVKRSVIMVHQKDRKLTLLSVDTMSFSRPRAAKIGVSMRDIFYLPNFLTADTQLLYVKFDYYNSAGFATAAPLREMFNYNQSLLNRHLPSADMNTYAAVKKLLISRHIW